MKLFFDCETTGKADFNLPSNSPCQPRIVQLAAVLTTDAGDEVSTVNLLVKPDGFVISDEAAKVHGITNEFAVAHGVSIKAAVGIFVHLAGVAESLHAYNADFDRIVMEGELIRSERPTPFVDGRLRCEMKPMTAHCKLPGKYGNYKWPNLTESHQHAYGKPFGDAHDALADVRAMIAVHKWRIAQPSNEVKA